MARAGLAHASPRRKAGSVSTFGCVENRAAIAHTARIKTGGKAKDKFTCWSPHSTFAALQRQVREYNDSLPPALTYSEENLQNHAAERLANQFIYLHIICQQNILFLNRFAIPVSPGARPPRDIPKDFLNDCGKLVIEAANQISKLIEAAAGHLLTVPFAGYCAYAASTVHVWGIFSKQPQLEAAAKENLRHNYKYLNKMKKYWGMFHYMAESVKDIYRAFADAALRGSSTPGSGVPQPMFQYGDWFDKYPHGVSRTDWEDTNVEMKKEPGTEAVMSHQSDLQSVEEFFASLSPPSKADHPRKTARRSIKSGGEGPRAKRTIKTDAGPAQPQVPPAPQKTGGEEPASFSNPDLSAPKNLAMQPDHQGPPVPPSFSHDPNQPLQPFQTQQQQPDFNLHSAPQYPFQSYPVNQLPQLDRQMVFGAYAGLDPSNVANLNQHYNQNFWEGVDLNGMSPNNNTSGYFGGNNEPSSAWFMPFNMDPPEIGRDSLGGLFGDVGMGMGFGGGVSFSGQGGQGHHPGHEGQVLGDLDIGMGEVGEDGNHG